jgi:dTDP-4-dehydrorhamnose reductase
VLIKICGVPLNKPKVLITGANGMLASDLIPILNNRYQLYCLSKRQLDIADKKAVESAVFGIRPEIVINCAAFTKVDDCEVNPFCYDVNGLGVFNLASASNKVKAKFVHFSTDYVFDGNTTTLYREDDERNPINSYGKSKLYGEIALESSSEKNLLIRVQWLFGHNGSNFVKTMLNMAANNKEIKIVSDQFGRPTSTKMVSRAVSWLLEQGVEGKWHIASNNFCSWYDFAKEILKNHPVKVVPCFSEEFPRPAKRPKNSILSVDKAIMNGVVLYPWQEHLQEYLK